MIAGSNARAMRSSPACALIDVREQHEWDEAHLEQAIHVPQGEVVERIDELAPDRSERLILHCRTDNRSARVADAPRRARLRERRRDRGRDRRLGGGRATPSSAPAA